MRDAPYATSTCCMGGIFICLNVLATVQLASIPICMHNAFTRSAGSWRACSCVCVYVFALTEGLLRFCGGNRPTNANLCGRDMPRETQKRRSHQLSPQQMTLVATAR